MEPYPLHFDHSLSKPEAELTEAVQCNAQPSSSSSQEYTLPPLSHSLTDSTTFDFPTLNIDGSLPDLTSSTPKRATPPAALSSLGAKYKMVDNAQENMEDSVSSLGDGYDMVDDISEMSSEDRETASVASTEQGDGQMTPSDSEDLVDLTGEQEDEAQDTSRTFGYSSKETLIGVPEKPPGAANVKAENDLMDSQFDEALETPRQSYLAGKYDGQPSPRAPPGMSSKPTPAVETFHVLFVSDRRDQTHEAQFRICSKIATSLSANKSPVLDIPVPLSNGSLLYRAGEIELVVQECVGAEMTNTSPEVYNLRLQDSRPDQTTIYTVGDEIQSLELKPHPDLVVFYLDQPGTYPAWFTCVKEAMMTLDGDDDDDNVPTVTIGGPGFDFDALSKVQEAKAYDSSLILDHDDFKQDSTTDLSTNIDNLLGRDVPPRYPQRCCVVGEPYRPGPWWKPAIGPLTRNDIVSGLLSALPLIALTFIAIWLRISYFASLQNPVVELAMRRDALSTAFANTFDSPDVPKNVDADFFLPKSIDGAVTSRYQIVPPNHIIVSISKDKDYKSFPSVASTSVLRDGNSLAFNMSELITSVYDFTISPEEAYGSVTVNMLTKHPAANVTATHNYGRSLLHQYKAASTELSKAMNKDVSIAKERAKSLGEKLGLEAGASAAATKEVTTALALYVAKEISIFANTAAAVLGKAGHHTAAKISKDFVVVSRDVAKFTKDISKLPSYALDAAQGTSQKFFESLPPRKTLTDPITNPVTKAVAISRARALSIRDKLARKRKQRELKKTFDSAFKELSVRTQNILKPMEKTGLGKLRDIAKCTTAKDYKQCRKRQKRDQDFLDAFAAAKQSTAEMTHRMTALHGSQKAATAEDKSSCFKRAEKMRKEGLNIPDQCGGMYEDDTSKKQGLKFGRKGGRKATKANGRSQIVL